MLPGCSKTRRGKREDFEKVEGNWDLPDDAVVALQLLRAQYPKCPAAGSYPVALVSQIYSLVKDRTAVDRELDKAVCRQELRLFRSPGHATDNLAMSMEDYTAAAHRAADVYASKRKGGSRGGGSSSKRLKGDTAVAAVNSAGRTSGCIPDHLQRNDLAGIKAKSSVDEAADLPNLEDVMDRFLHGVLPEHPRVSISSADLQASLAAPRNALDDCNSSLAHERNDTNGTAATGSAKATVPLKRLNVSEVEQAIEVLDHAGLIIRKNVNTYLFAIPGIGPLNSHVLHGRQEMLQLMARKKFGEILVRDAEKLKLKVSSLGPRFHLRDLVGRGSVEIKETTAGPLAKVIAGAKVS